MTTLLQIWLIFQRAMRQSLRNPVWVIIGMSSPSSTSRSSGRCSSH